MMNDNLVTRIGDRTHGATLGECEQWAEEVRLKDVYIVQLKDNLLTSTSNAVQLGILVDKLEADNAAQVQTIKAAHIRTAEVSVRHSDCQQQVERLRKALKSLYLDNFHFEEIDQCWRCGGIDGHQTKVNGKQCEFEALEAGCEQ